MHCALRAVGVFAAATAMTIGSLSTAHADEPASFADRLDQIRQVDEAVGIGQSPLEPVTKDGAVTLGVGAASSITLDLPTDRAKPQKLDGRYVLAADDASVAVAPTATGTQILVGIESSEAPTSYEFGLQVPAGFAPELQPSGSVEIVDQTGRLAAQVEAPWAFDADGRRVPTHFEVDAGAITQVVDHHAADFAYPIVADPKVKFCDWKTAVCIKWSKKETRSIANGFDTSFAAGVSVLCGKIPANSAPGLAARAICVVAVNLYFNKIRKTFITARKKKKCVETKFRIIGPAIVTAKVVKC